MTNIVTVTKADVSKNGAPRVYFDNKHAWSDAYYLGKRTEAPAVGVTIDADTSSSEFKGKVYWYLNKWKIATTDKPVGTDPPVQSATKPQTQILPPVVSKHWMIDYGDLSRFVSNVVGSAIAAGLIKRPTDIHPWIAAAYSALQGLREGKPVDFEDVWMAPEPVELGEREDEDFDEYDQNAPPF
jgi:hypothetical protein